MRKTSTLSSQNNSLVAILMALFLSMLFACSSRKPQEPTVLPSTLTPEAWRKTLELPFEESIKFNTITDPKYQVHTLPNGIVVHLLNQPRAVFTNIRFIVMNSPAHQSVLTDLVHTYFQYGSRAAKDLDFQVRLRNLGSDFSHSQYADFSESRIDVMSHDTAPALQLLSNLIQSPNFSEAHMDKVKREVALYSKISGVIDQQYARQVFYSTLYGKNHPYSKRKIDSDSLDAYDLTSIRDYYKSQHLASPSHLIVVGRIPQPERLLRTIRAAFDFSRPKLKANPIKWQKPKPDSDIYFVHRKHAQQVNIVSGTLASPKQAPAWFYQSIVTEVLGGGSHSRLFKDLREKRGLTYTIRASLPSRKLTAPFFISTSCGHHKLAAMLTGIFQHRDYLINHDLTLDELTLHQHHLLGRLAMFRETPSQLAAQRARRVVFGEADNYLSRYQQEARRLDVKKIRSSAKNLLSRPWITVMVGNYDLVKDQLAQYFPNLTVKLVEE